MKIDVVCLTKRANYDGPLTVSYETVRVPSSIKILDRKTVEEILRERVRRIRRLREYWKGKITENQNLPFIDDHSDRVLISWSPIITTDALNFICDNF
jgi:hypothetical protein